MSILQLAGQRPTVTQNAAHRVPSLTCSLQPSRCPTGRQPFTTHTAVKSLRTHQQCQQQRSSRVYTSAGEVEIDIEETAMERMEKSVEATRRSFASVRTGRANPAMLDRIEVDYYGTPTPLKTIAGVSVPESTMLLVQPYDTSAMQAIEKAIMQSDLGLTPSNDGKVIRLNIPPLTADRRKEMTKTVAKLGEEGKVAVRNIRRDAMKAVERLEKDGVVGEDERKGLETSVQKLTDAYIKEIEALITSKSEELKKV